MSSKPFSRVVLIGLHHLNCRLGMNGYQRITVIQVAGLETTPVDIQVMFTVLAAADQMHIRWMIGSPIRWL